MLEGGILMPGLDKVALPCQIICSCHQQSSSELRSKFRETRSSASGRQRFLMCSVIYSLSIVFILFQSYLFSKVILRQCPFDLFSSCSLMLALLSCCSLWVWILMFLALALFPKEHSGPDLSKVRVYDTTKGYISQITTEKWLWVSKHLTHASIDTQETKWDILFVCSEMMM